MNYILRAQSSEETWHVNSDYLGREFGWSSGQIQAFQMGGLGINPLVIAT